MRQAGEDFPEVSIRFKPSPFAALDDGVDDRTALSRFGFANEQPVLFADGRGPDRPAVAGSISSRPSPRYTVSVVHWPKA